MGLGVISTAVERGMLILDSCYSHSRKAESQSQRARMAHCGCPSCTTLGIVAVTSSWRTRRARRKNVRERSSRRRRKSRRLKSKLWRHVFDLLASRRGRAQSRRCSLSLQHK